MAVHTEMHCLLHSPMYSPTFLPDRFPIGEKHQHSSTARWISTRDLDYDVSNDIFFFQKRPGY
jgi:hypothetical protein